MPSKFFPPSCQLAWMPFPTEICYCNVCIQNHITAVSVYRIILLLYLFKNHVIVVSLPNHVMVMSVFRIVLLSLCKTMLLQTSVSLSVAECVWKRSFSICRTMQSALCKFWWTAANPQTGQCMVTLEWDGVGLSKPADRSPHGLLTGHRLAYFQVSTWLFDRSVHGCKQIITWLMDRSALGCMQVIA